MPRGLARVTRRRLPLLRPQARRLPRAPHRRPARRLRSAVRRRRALQPRQAAHQRQAPQSHPARRARLAPPLRPEASAGISRRSAFPNRPPDSVPQRPPAMRAAAGCIPQCQRQPDCLVRRPGAGGAGRPSRRSPARSMISERHKKPPARAATGLCRGLALCGTRAGRLDPGTLSVAPGAGGHAVGAVDAIGPPEEVALGHVHVPT